MDSTLLIVLIVVLVLAIGGGIAWAVVRHRYVKSLEAKGWTWEGSAGPQVTIGMNNPPFGVGFDRNAGHFIHGRAADGTRFRAFSYRSDQGAEKDLVVTVPLPKSLPWFHVFPPERPRQRVVGVKISDAPGTVVAQDPRFGERAMAALAPHLQPPQTPSGGTIDVDISIDHASLVMFGAPKKADDLEVAVNWLASLGTALASSNALAFDGEEPPRHLSFHQRSYWVYIPRDDSFLGRVNHTGGGFDHQARDIIVSDNYGLPFIRLHHHWKTRHTRTDSKGNTTTEVRNHDEYICEFATSFPFGDLSVNWGILSGGQVAKFESSDFNRQFKVRSGNPRFASDVIHPRQMEYMLARRGPNFSIEPNGSIRVAGRKWFPEEVDAASEYLRGFFCNVPNFVWQELGAGAPPRLELPAPKQYS